MDDNLAIKVEHISKTFKLPHEKNNSIKGAVVNFYRRKKTYELQQALKDVSFAVEKGEFFGIVGRNGSGKSTLLKMLAGTYSPSEGHIQVNGRLTPFIELGVGFNPELTGRENVFLNGALLGFNRNEVKNMYDDVVAFAELERFMDQKLKNYSSGMQVRLAFSIAIRAKGDILLLDEVLAVGDAAFQQKCYDYFEELRLEHKTVVFVSHDMSAVRRFCRRAIYIDKGHLTHIGTPAEISDIYVEDNIQKTDTTTKLDTSADHKITVKVVEQDSGSVQLRFDYHSKDSVEMYIGISLQKEGLSVGEITTSLQKPLIGNGTVSFTLATDFLNGGSYQVGVGLFKLRNRQLLTVNKGKCQFSIKGSDVTKGAALKLPDTWEYEHAKN